MDVNLVQATNYPIADGIGPDRERVKPEFPYFGAPYSVVEQTGLAPAPGNPAPKGLP